MHKKVYPDKLGRPTPSGRNVVRGGASHHNAGTVKPLSGRPDSVKDLLTRVTPVLAGITRRVREQQDLKDWTRARLPPELAVYVTEILEKEGELTLFAQSAAWAGRLRYAIEDLEAALAADRPDANIRSVRIRVMPRNGKP